MTYLVTRAAAVGLITAAARSLAVGCILEVWNENGVVEFSEGLRL